MVRLLRRPAAHDMISDGNPIKASSARSLRVKLGRKLSNCRTKSVVLFLGHSVRLPRSVSHVRRNGANGISARGHLATLHFREKERIRLKMGISNTQSDGDWGTRTVTV